jgi:hypothetical protein
MLIATPTQGGIHRNPNWVRTNPAPSPNIDVRARKIAVVMGVVPRMSRLTMEDRQPRDAGQCGSHKV